MPDLLAIALYITLRAALYGIIALIAVSWALGMVVIYTPTRIKGLFR